MTKCVNRLGSAVLHTSSVELELFTSLWPVQRSRRNLLVVAAIAVSTAYVW